MQDSPNYNQTGVLAKVSIVPTLSSEVSNEAVQYVQRIYAEVQKRDPHEPEFHQAVQEFLESITPF